MHLSRPIGNLDRCTIPASLGGAVLNLSDIGHGSKQPDSRRHQHDKESKYHRILEVAIAFVVRRLRLCPSSAVICQSRLRRIEMNVTAIVGDTIARFRMLFTLLGKRIFLRQIIRTDRRLAVAAGNIEHVIRLA